MRRFSLCCVLGLGMILAVGCTVPDRQEPSQTVCTDGGDECGAGTFCLFEPGTCIQETREGVCTEIPDACTEEYAPVCGCDGVTYGNECAAWAAGASIAITGECPEED